MSGYEGGNAGINQPTRQGIAPEVAPVPAEPVRAAGGNRLFSCVLALIVGLVFGAVGTVQHQSTLSLGPVPVPLGLILSLAGVLALLVGFRLLFTDRFVVLCAAIGVIAIVTVFSLPSPGGTVLIPQGVAGLVWTIGSVLIATIVVAWPRLPERSAARTRTAGEA